MSSLLVLPARAPCSCADRRGQLCPGQTEPRRSTAAPRTCVCVARPPTRRASSSRAELGLRPRPFVVVAAAIMSDPETYTEAVLGKPNDEYCRWILKPESWGGTQPARTRANTRRLGLTEGGTCGGAHRRDRAGDPGAHVQLRDPGVRHPGHAREPLWSVPSWRAQDRGGPWADGMSVAPNPALTGALTRALTEALTGALIGALTEALTEAITLTPNPALTRP